MQKKSQQLDKPFYMLLRDELIQIGHDASLSVPSGEALPNVFSGSITKAMEPQSPEAWLFLSLALQMDRSLLSRAYRLFLRSRLSQRSGDFTTPLTDLSESIYLLNCIAESPSELQKLTCTRASDIEGFIVHLLAHLHYFVHLIVNSVRSKYGEALKRWWQECVYPKFESSCAPRDLYFSYARSPPLNDSAMGDLLEGDDLPEMKPIFPPGPPPSPVLNSKRYGSLFTNPKQGPWTDSIADLHEAVTELWLILDKLIPRSELVRSAEGELKFHLPTAVAHPRLLCGGRSYERPGATEPLDEACLPSPICPPLMPLEVARTWNTPKGLVYLLEKAKAAYPDLKIDFEPANAVNRLFAETKRSYQAGEQIASDPATAWSGFCPCLCEQKYADLSSDGVMQSLAARYKLPELVLLTQLYDLNGPTQSHQWFLPLASHWTDAKKLTINALGEKKAHLWHSKDPHFPLSTYSEVWKCMPMRNTLDFHAFLDMLCLIRANATPLRLNSHILPEPKLAHTHKPHCPMAHSWKYLYFSSAFMLLKAAKDEHTANVRLVPKPSASNPHQKFILTVEATSNIPSGSTLFFDTEDLLGCDWCPCGDPRVHQRCVFLPHTVPLQLPQSPSLV